MLTYIYPKQINYISRLTKSLSLVLCLLFLQAINSHSIYAALNKSPDELHLNKLNFCPITKQVVNDYEPEEFAKSNNLLRMAGQEAIFCGQRIIVYGKVLDQNCVPVSDAKVYAWQVGCDAKYPYKPLKNIADPEMYKEKKESTFVGHGTATTNNKGEFIFVTTYPKAVHDIGPHINFRIQHRDIGTLQTAIELFGNRLANPGLNPDLEKIIPAAEDAEASIYEIKIVMPGTTLKYY